MVTVHVDLRELSGLEDDEPVPYASLRVAPLTDDEQHVQLFDGVGEFDTNPGDVTIREYGFRGARNRTVTVPAGTDVNYGDL